MTQEGADSGGPESRAFLDVLRVVLRTHPRSGARGKEKAKRGPAQVRQGHRAI